MAKPLLVIHRSSKDLSADLRIILEPLRAERSILLWSDDEKGAVRWNKLVPGADREWYWPGKERKRTDKKTGSEPTVIICQTPCEYAKVFAVASEVYVALVPSGEDIPHDLVDAARSAKCAISVADLPAGPWHLYQADYGHLSCDDPLYGPRLMGQFKSLLSARRKALSRVKLLSETDAEKCVSVGFGGWKIAPRYSIFRLPSGERAPGSMVALMRVDDRVWFASSEPIPVKK